MSNQDNLRRQTLGAGRQFELAELQAHRRGDWRYNLRQTLNGGNALRLLGFASVVVALVFIGQTIVAHLRDQMHAEVATANAQFIEADGQNLGDALSLDNLENTLIGFYLRVRQAELNAPQIPRRRRWSLR